MKKIFSDSVVLLLAGLLFGLAASVLLVVHPGKVVAAPTAIYVSLIFIATGIVFVVWSIKISKWNNG